MSLAIGFPSPVEIMWIVGAAVLLFGVHKVPKMARAMGSSLSMFKLGKAEGEKELKQILEDTKNQLPEHDDEH